MRIAQEACYFNVLKNYLRIVVVMFHTMESW